MFILGLNFGHDASVTVLENGAVKSHVLRERHSGIRHHLGLDRASIELALAETGIGVDDLSGIAVAATQQMPCLNNDPSYLQFFESAHANSAISPQHRLIDNPWWRDAKETLIVERWRKTDEPSSPGMQYLQQWEKSRRLPMGLHVDWEVLGILSPLYGPQDWLTPYSLHATTERMNQFLSSADDKAIPQGFHFPLELTLAGKRIPAWFVNHHMAHAASSFYSSPFEGSVIFTHDGGTGSESGFVFVGNASKIVGVGPHYLECGQFYDYVAERLGLGGMGGAGKLMGLAPYGQGLLDRKIPAGTRIDWEQWIQNRHGDVRVAPYDGLFDALLEAGTAIGLDISRIGQAEFVLEGCVPEIAHAVQHMLEESIAISVQHAVDALARNGNQHIVRNLCLSGGVALNCPANSRLWNSGRFDHVHVEPHCEDGGLSIGAAQYVYYHLLDGKPRLPQTELSSSYAMLGPRFEGSLQQALEQNREFIEWTRPDHFASEIGNAVAQNQVIAIFEGNYETGPRALGHRSIIANPGDADNWHRVNVIKRREQWRPFAPAVLVDDLLEWFEQGPPASPFMLFTYRVREAKIPLLPAVTHIDKTGRVQTVTRQDGTLFHCLMHLKNMGLPPVVMNTSFNGPGQPIVQDPQRAIAMLLGSSLDALFIDGVKVVKRKAAEF